MDDCSTLHSILNDFDCSTLHSMLNDFRKEGKYCDVTIQIAAETFQCHRVILASVSTYFDTMFSAPFKESYVKNITLHNIDVEAFAKILDFAYTGCKPIITEENAYDLLTTSDFLIIPVIKDYCIEFIQENLNQMKFENLVEMMVFVSNIDEFDISNSLMNYIVKHFNSVSLSYDFLEMPFDELDWLVCKYEKPIAEYVAMKDQNIFLDALIRWVRHSPEERAKYFEELAKSIDFEKISEEYITYMTKEYKINFEKCTNRSTLKKCITNFLTHKKDNCKNLDVLPISYGTLLLEEKLELHAFVECIRSPQSFYPDRTVIEVVSISKYKPDWSISLTQKSSFDDDCIQMISSGERSNHYLYRLQGGGFYNFLDRLDFRAHSSVNIWSDLDEHILTSPPFQISSTFNMCGMRNNIYLYSHNNSLTSPRNRVDVPVTLTEEEIRRNICSYNCELDQWFPVPKMKIKLDDSCITADDSLVYLIGGKNFKYDFFMLEGYVQAYDYRSPKWMELSKTNNLYCKAACCMLNGKIYVSDAQKVEAYDPVAGKWEIISTIYNIDNKNSHVTQEYINQLRYNHAIQMVSYENMLWIISSFENKDWCYTSIIDPQEPTWRISRFLEAAIHPCETFVVKEAVVFKA